jgi:hypothetical protein
VFGLAIARLANAFEVHVGASVDEKCDSGIIRSFPRGGDAFTLISYLAKFRWPVV